MTSITSALSGDLQTWLSDQGQPSFRFRQIANWMFARRAGQFSDMTDLPRVRRDELSQRFQFWSTEVAQHTRATDGTEKLLLQFKDASRIECVLLRDGDRRTICISTQVGCAMGCAFCASGLDGVDRNLTEGEIVEQMLRLQRLLPSDERLSHIVVMGMGEPLANLDGLLPALKEARRKDGLGISVRRITISTVGLPKAMGRLAQLDPLLQRFHVRIQHGLEVLAYDAPNRMFDLVVSPYAGYHQNEHGQDNGNEPAAAVSQQRGGEPSRVEPAESRRLRSANRRGSDRARYSRDPAAPARGCARQSTQSRPMAFCR